MRHDLKECGKHIQQLRKERELTQEQLAEKLNVSQNTIAKIESGLRRPSIDFLLEISEFFNVSTNYLVFGVHTEAVEDASLIYTGIDKHTGENIGLYSTVISREDYDAMAGQLAASMEADAPREDDIPERPIFTNISDYSYDDDEDDRPLSMVAESRSVYGTKRVPIVQSSKPTTGGTYRPSYVPPTPSVPVKKKPLLEVDTSNVHAGTIVTHKAFGTGQVKGVDGSMIIVSFKGVDKKFQFPGAFEQGFLKLDEE